MKPILILLLLASPAAALDNVFYRSFNGYAYPGETPLVEGEPLRFILSSEGSEPITIDFPIPKPSIVLYATILESDAATYGFDWDALESLLEGPAIKSTDFGPLGFIEHTPYIREYPGEYVDNVELTRIDYSFAMGRVREEWNNAAITLTGNFGIYAPEPSSFVLLLIGLCHVMARSRLIRR